MRALQPIATTLAILWLSLIGFVFSLGAFGCAPGVDGVRQGVANVKATLIVGYKALNAADQAAADHVLKRARGGDFVGAANELKAWREKRNAIVKGLDDAALTVDLACQAIDTGLTNTQASGWIARLAALLPQLGELAAQVARGGP